VNSTPATATLLDPLPTTPDSPARIFQNLAIERTQDIDYFRFTAPAFTGLSIRVDPVGSSYSSGPQDGLTTVVNALSIHDLAIDVLDSTGVEVLGSINDTGAGFVEQDLIPLPPAGGEFLFRVRTASISTESQRYRLTVSLTPVETPPPSVNESFSIY
jgi:hypothetical protein